MNPSIFRARRAMFAPPLDGVRLHPRPLPQAGRCGHRPPRSRSRSLVEGAQKEAHRERWAQVVRRRLLEHQPVAIPAGRKPEWVVQNP